MRIPIRRLASFAFAALAAGCASQGFGPSHAVVGEGASFWRYDQSFDPPEQEAVWRRRGVLTAVVTAGEVVLAADGASIERLAPDAYLSIEEEGRGEHRELWIEPDPGGAPSYSYQLDGGKHEFDADARAWLARRLPEVVDRTGVGAEARARALLAAGGPSAVFAELATMENGRSRRIYVQVLVDRPDLSAAQAAELAWRGAEALSGDSERAVLLTALAALHVEDAELTRALARAAASIDSSSQRAGVLTNLIERRRPKGDALLALLESAGGIASSSERQSVLLQVLDEGELSDAALERWLAITGGISSSALQSAALRALVAREWVGPESIAAASRVARGISSPSERADFAALVFRHPRSDARAIDAGLELVESVGSSAQQQAALEVLLARRGLDRATLARCAAVASSLSQPNARAAVQQRLIELLLAEGAPRGDERAEATRP